MQSSEVFGNDVMLDVVQAPPPRRAGWPRRLAVLGLLAFAAAVLSGCLTILPQWQPTDEIQHQNSSMALDDSNPIVVQSGQERFILFIGETTDGDVDLFLQRMNAAGQLVGSPAQLTVNSGEDSQPQLAEQDGWLYLVWRYRHTPSDPYEVWWARVSTTTLFYAAGPEQVNDSLTGDGHTPQLAVRANGTTVAVWEQRNGITGTIYYRQVNFDSTFASGPVIVSQGTGCAPAGYHQRAPRVTRSFPTGSYAQIAWIGDNPDGDSVYWREFDNGSSSPSSNCLVLSSPASYSGVEVDLDMAINPNNNRSYVAWTHLNEDSDDVDVYFRSVNFSWQLCDILNVSNAVTTTSEGGVRIAAGHTISNWVHLVWERFGLTVGQDAIGYALIQDGANCSVSGQKTPTKITPLGNLSLSGAPVPAGADVDSPRIAVARNAIISRYNGGSGGTLMMSAQADAEAPPVESAAEAGAEATVSDERPALPAGVAHDASETEAQSEVAPTASLDCAATPDHPRCQELAALAEANGRIGPLSSQAAAAASSFQCGTNAADAIVVSFFDYTNDQMYAALFQAGEVLYNGTCYRVVSAQYPSNGGLKLQPLTRTDYGSPNDVDRDDHYPFISARGLPTVAWRGREPATIFSPTNEEIYVAEGKFETYAPIVRKP